MTESTAHVASSPAKTTSFWEDLIDICFQPAAVFRRREGKSVWPPLLFVAIAVGLITFATFNTTVQPIFDAEYTRSTAKQIAKTPQAAEAISKMRDTMGQVTKFAAGPATLLTMVVLGFVVWLVGKLVGSRSTFEAAIGVAAWAYVPRVIGGVLGGVQGLLMDPEKLNSAASIALGPARFFDADATNPLLYQLLGRFDLITIWVTVLLAVGVYVTGKVSKERAVVFGLLIWLVGSLPVLQRGYMAM